MAALQIPGLDAKDHYMIRSLFRDVHTKSEKEFIHGRYLDPIVTRVRGSVDRATQDADKGSNEKSATFFAVPYFSLEQFCSHGLERDTELHPVRGLLQTHYEMESTEKRERHQVLRKLKVVENGIHVPQLWCLLLNNGNYPQNRLNIAG